MKIVLLPQLSDLPPQSIKLLSLRIPGQDEDSMFIFSPVVGLLQLQLWENPINSWAIENTVIQATNFDPLYILIPLLQKESAKGFCSFDDILYENENPDIANFAGLPDLHDKLKKICDTNFEFERNFYRLSQEKLSAWLHRKIDNIVTNIDEMLAFKEFRASNPDEKAKLAIRVISDNLCDELRDMMVKEYNLKDLSGEKIAYFVDSMKHKSKDEGDKKIVKKVNRSFNVQAKVKEVKPRSTSGMKKMSEYFKKKN